MLCAAVILWIFCCYYVKKHRDDEEEASSRFSDSPSVYVIPVHEDEQHDIYEAHYGSRCRVSRDYCPMDMGPPPPYRVLHHVRIYTCAILHHVILCVTLG